ncbi:MAG TPA: DUF2383 domain-containing protein [Rhodanobacter sp.]
MPPHIQKTTCNALIQRSIDLRQMYCHAAEVCEPGLRMVLGENAQTLDLLIADLQVQLRACGGKPCERGSWRGVARRHAATWRVHAAAHRDNAWIRALAQHESALLHAFEQAIAVASTESALSLRRQLPRLRGLHLDMHSLAGTAH